MDKYIDEFLSTPSARRATGSYYKPADELLISIHALREEGDIRKVALVHTLRISIHALREEGDMQTSGHAAGTDNFYPRPPRGGRRAHQLYLCRSHPISIHALREEGDPVCCCFWRA